jgi:hypothetical protein
VQETSDGFEITDRLTGASLAGHVEIAFLLAADLDATIEGQSVVVRRQTRPVITLLAPDGARIETVRADAVSARGFQSPGFGVLLESTTVVFRAPASERLWRSSILVNPLT